MTPDEELAARMDRIAALEEAVARMAVLMHAAGLMQHDEARAMMAEMGVAVGTPEAER